MPTFIVQGRYTKDAIQGMMAKPEDRGPEVAKLVEAFGGKMHGYYVTFGENDFMIVCEGPDEKSVASAVLVAAAGGGVTDLKTTVAITSAEAKDVFATAGEGAKAFRSAGS